MQKVDTMYLIGLCHIGAALTWNMPWASKDDDDDAD